jgi:uncharacterized protein DUF1501
MPCPTCNADGTPHYGTPQSRRDFLYRAGGGFGALALWSLLSRDASSILRAAAPADAALAKALPLNPLAAKAPPLPAKAKSVIWCFLDGGPSHLDLFDPKPTLAKLAGQPLPASFPRP